MASSTTPDTRRTPRPDVTPPRIGALGMARWAWRQLTSMRTALLLLLLIAVAAIPGSVWPQRSIDPTAVATYLDDNPTFGPWLDRFGFFDVFISPWFSAIYLLLVVSLCGCILPRSMQHWRNIRSAPPAAPKRLGRLPVHEDFVLDGDVAAVTERARRGLRSRRYRVREADETGARALSGETGYLRETGNLLFHTGIVVVVVALAWGYLVGWKADRIVVVGQSFTNTVAGYDTFAPGPWVSGDDLQPFQVKIDSLDVRFEDQAGGAQFGAARDFDAQTTVTPEPGAAPEKRALRVNGPLAFGGASVYLLGNGYAPTITVRDGAGKVVYQQPTPFLPQDGVYTSVGAVKVPGAQPQQLGFSGLFLPTAYETAEGLQSGFPDALNPTLVLTGYKGQLFSGRAQSVYALDTTKMTRITGADGKPLRIQLQPGQKVDLPNGQGSISFDKLQRWAGVSTRYDPARPLALGSALVALTGLVGSLMIKRRRVFVRVRPAEPGPDGQLRSRVEIGALARGEDPLLAKAVTGYATALGRPDESSPEAKEPGEGPATDTGRTPTT